MFWGLAIVVVALLFGSMGRPVEWAVTLSTFLPLAISISILFNRKILPSYLETENHLKFALDVTYLTVFALWLSMVWITILFIFLAEYQYSNMPKNTTDITKVGLLIFAFVALEAVATTIRSLRDQKKDIQNHGPNWITVISERKHLRIKVNEITYVESLSDYIKLHLGSRTIITKETISNFENRLPDAFKRVHRSFIVNSYQVDSVSSTEVILGDVKVPIGRKFKENIHNLGR